jgi:tetratricopeptide (TPR) repeat protein
MPQCKYHAFISYSHQDSGWGAWLHKALETYPIPQRLVGRQTAAGTIPKKLAPIFRDRDELPSAHDLGRKVNEALAQSANLVVICSPHSAASRWVDEEVREFKRLGREERVFCLIVGGEPNASDMPGSEAEECFAPALRFQLDAGGGLTTLRTEPIAADVRPGKDGKANARLKLVSGLLDVGFDELRQREQQRAHRKLAWVAGLALLVMIVTSVLAVQAVIARKAAEVARQAAERRQKQAEHLVGFMLGDLNDKLAQVSRLDIMEAVDDQAMQYFQSLPTTDVTDEVLAQRAKALEKIGSVRMDQGHLPEAMQAYRASLKFSSALASAAPEDSERQVAYARNLAFIGTAHWYQGQIDDALRGFESAQKVLLRAQTHAPTDLQVQFELATIDNNIGHVLESRGRLDEATVQYRNMLVLTEKLVAAQPGNTRWVAQSGLAHNNLGKMALLRGDLKGAIAEYSADDRIESALSARDPKDNNQRENVLLVRGLLGGMLALVGDVEASIDYLHQAIAIADQLRAVEPNNASFQEDKALCAMRLSRILRLRGDLAVAREQSTQSISLLRELTRQDPANTSWQREYAEALLEQAAQLRAAGQAANARGRVQDVLEILAPLRSQQAGDRATLLAATTADLLLADLDERQDPDTAARQRNAVLRALRAPDSGDPRLLALQVEALLALRNEADAQPIVRRLWTGGYRDSALLAVLQRARIDYPVNTAFRERLQAAIRASAPLASTASQAQE